MSMTVRKKQLEAFVKRGKTLEEQNYRRYLVTRQLRLEKEKNWKNFNAGLMDLLAKVFSGMDTAMSWGTAVAQDATGMPTGYAYNIPRTLTLLSWQRPTKATTYQTPTQGTQRTPLPPTSWKRP